MIHREFDFRVVSSMKPDDFTWCMLQYEEGGCPVIVRALQQMPAAELCDAHPIQTIVSWDYAPEPNGMPQEAELLRMNEFEELLIAGVTHVAVLALCRTGNGLRDWWFYAVDAASFMQALNLALAGYPRFPISVSTCEDAAWDAIDELIGTAEFEINDDGEIV